MSPPTARQRRNGFVLVLVLGLVLLLSALLFGFNKTTLIGLDTAESFLEFEQALNCAQAGLAIAMAAIRDVNDLTQDQRFAKLCAGDETFPIGKGACTLTITGESGRLNINRLKDKEGNLDRTRIEQFLRLIDLANQRDTSSKRIGYDIVPAIIDWIDQDDDITRLPFVSRDNQGAENRHYATRQPAYRCKNRPVDTVEELQCVKGITPEAFEALRDFLTTTGDGRININTAPKLVIQCLSEQMDPALAQMIIQRRRTKPFESVAELKDVPGMTDNIYLAIKNTIAANPTERHYRVLTRGKVGNRTCEVEAMLRRNTQGGNVDIVLYRES
jgi:general secretion pathway protein K